MRDAFSKDHILELHESAMLDDATIFFHEILEHIPEAKDITPTDTKSPQQLQGRRAWAASHPLDSRVSTNLEVKMGSVNPVVLNSF